MQKPRPTAKGPAMPWFQQSPRNPNGPRIHDSVVILASDLDMVALQKEAAFLEQYVLIARFVVDLSLIESHII